MNPLTWCNQIFFYAKKRDVMLFYKKVVNLENEKRYINKNSFTPWNKRGR